jgi:hypothetical protein
MPLMTRENEQRFISAVENPVFKGGARLLMWVSATLLALIVWQGNRALDTIDRLDRNQARIEAQIERIELTVANDRKAAGVRDDALNTRIDIVSGRVTDTQREYARVNDVLSGFTLRDQRIEALDRRVGSLEGRMNGRGDR